MEESKVLTKEEWGFVLESLSYVKDHGSELEQTAYFFVSGPNLTAKEIKTKADELLTTIIQSERAPFNFYE